MPASPAVQKTPVTRVLHGLAAGVDGLFGPWTARLGVDKTLEDAAMDLAALRLAPKSRVVVAGQAADNAFACLTTDPEAVFVAASSLARMRLIQLRLAALQSLPTHREFFRFVAEPRQPDTLEQYQRHVRPCLDADARLWWERSPFAAMLFPPRIQALARGRRAVTRLGRMCGFVHFLAPFAGCVPSRALEAKTVDGQRGAFDKDIAPLFDSLRGRRILGAALRLFMHPLQRARLRKAGGKGVFASLRNRAERLVCDLPLAENPYVWMALADAYSPIAAPLFLAGNAHGPMQANADRLQVRHASLTEFLASQPTESMDGFLLSDTMDRMLPGQTTMLWAQIARTARPGARVLSRSIGSRCPADAFVPHTVRDAFDANSAVAADLLATDRSAVWGDCRLRIKR